MQNPDNEEIHEITDISDMTFYDLVSYLAVKEEEELCMHRDVILCFLQM